MIVHNISDRVTSKEGPRAIPVGGVLLRPGKHSDVDVTQLAKKILALHGTCLWFGELPQHLRGGQKQEVVSTEKMSAEDILVFLSSKTADELLELATKLTPPLLFSGKEPMQVMAQRLVSVLIKGERVPDPEAFFWLRRWIRSGDTFEERG